MQRESSSTSSPWPVLGCGVGLRSQHYQEILTNRPKMDWFEAITENFMDSGGRPLAVLEEVRKVYPVALHGVSLSIGSADPLDEKYLSRLKMLVDRIDPATVSDHLCWTGVEGRNLHDLLPLPFTEEAVAYVAARIRRVQDAIGRRFMIENVSSYVTYKHSAMKEWEFLAAVAREADCGILLDLNNIYVNAKNHAFDPYEYLAGVPAARVGQFHLAGHTDMGDFLFDTHSASVVEPVWDLYKKALEHYGPVSTLIEWDEAVPEFAVLAAEAEKARKIFKAYEKKPKLAVQTESARLSAPETPSKRFAEEQRQIKTHILPGSEGKSDLETFLNPQAGTSPNERIHVYAGGYVTRIQEALAETFPTILHVLGGESFHRLAHDYAVAYPSQEYNLGQAGRFLPEFLKSHAIGAKFAFLMDLAKLEWLAAESFHSSANTGFDASPLAKLSEEETANLRFTFQPSFRLLSSDWPVVDIWQARLKPVSEMNVKLVDRPQSAVIYRVGFEVRVETVSKREYETLTAFRDGATLGQVCQTIAETDDDEPVALWFGSWASKGFLSAVTTAPKSAFVRR